MENKLDSMVAKYNNIVDNYRYHTSKEESIRDILMDLRREHKENCDEILSIAKGIRFGKLSAKEQKLYLYLTNYCRETRLVYWRQSIYSEKFVKYNGTYVPESYLEEIEEVR